MAIEATGILLPALKDEPFEVILETREKAKDELIELRHYVSKVLGEYDLTSSESLEDYVNYKINRDIKEFNENMKEGKNGFLQKIIEKLKNPLPIATLLSPLYASYFGDFQTILSAFVSLGLISAATALEYSSYKRSVKNHSLYFRTKLNNRLHS